MLVWSHGHTGVVQSPHGFLVERLGYYLRLKADRAAEAWVHYGPPTSLAGDGRTALVAVRVRLRTFGEAAVGRVHVWDGSRQIAAHDGLGVQLREGGAVAADRPTDEFGELELALRRPERLRSAVGVSILVSARQALDAVALSAVGLELDG